MSTQTLRILIDQRLKSDAPAVRRPRRRIVRGIPSCEHDASGAIREAVATIWPPRAVGLRLLDFEGREIFERLKADLR